MDIYKISESDTGELRYVGKTVLPLEKRMKEHLWPSSLKKPGHKNKWLKSLAARGAYPVIESIQTLYTLEDLDAAEMYWIGFLKAEGCNLTNSTSGGEGLRNPSLEVRARMSAAKKGKIPYASSLPKSLETKELIRQIRTGSTATVQTKAKMSAAKKGLMPKNIDLFKTSRIGKKNSPETIARMRVAAQLRVENKRKHEEIQ